MMVITASVMYLWLTIIVFNHYGYNDSCNDFFTVKYNSGYNNGCSNVSLNAG